VLQVEVADEADLDRLRTPSVGLASVVAELVVSKGQYTDSYEKTRRAVPMGVPAELLWRQLPPTTFATPRFVLSAQLEPWHQVGGDAFDYSLDGDTLHVAVFDGMGHGLQATLLASVALAAYRNARRSGQSLVETAAVVDEVLGDQFGDDSFVTAVLGRLDLVTGTLSLLSAAHPAPLLIRNGRPVGEVSVEPGLPLGFGTRADSVADASLEPGDRLLMFSDGVVEARSTGGEFFGIDRLVDLVTRQESGRQPAPETLRRLINAVLEHQQDMLQDDATVLLLEWAGDPRALLPAELPSPHAAPPVTGRR
jgi:serine phosphatase RsbU (regulator of sigma subunit)